MALVKCSKCGGNVSDKAEKCPHCGSPVLTKIVETENQDVEMETVPGEKNEQEEQVVDNVRNISVKSKKVKMVVIGACAALLLVVGIAIIVGRGFFPRDKSNRTNDVELDGMSESELDGASETKQSTVGDKKSDNMSEADKPAITVSWTDGQVPTQVGNEESSAIIKDTKIVDSSFGKLLVMDFEYTNNSEDSKNFINDSNCTITPYQNGVALEGAGATSEQGKYDYSEAFTSIKKGAVISTQLVWVLKDTVTPVEMDFGCDENYRPVFSSTLNILGGETSNDGNEESEAIKSTESDYQISWENGDAPERVGENGESIAIIMGTSIVESPKYGPLLVMDFEYTNNSENAKNFINDMNCKVSPYQKGIELEKPGETSESGIFDYSDTFTSIKKGGTIRTQLVWVLKDIENPVEIEFGYNKEYKPEFIATFTISPK